MRGRVHSREFKVEVVQQVISGAKRPSQVCREYGLADGLLHRWRQEYVERGEAAFTARGGLPGGDIGRPDCGVGAALWAVEPGAGAGKKSLAAGGSFPVAERHAMIKHLHATTTAVPLATLCALFGVSRSWYYARAGAAVGLPDLALREAIEQLGLDCPGYGYRRITKQLQRDGWFVNHKRVLRIMREESLLCHLKRHFVSTTDSAHASRRYPNRIKGLGIDRLDQVWVADITYVRLPTAFVYLAALLDAYSRRCIGWHLAPTIDTQLTLTALNDALTRRQPRGPVIHHSDQGVQYASHADVARLEDAGLQISMAAVGNPYENAQAESFFKTLKREEVSLNEYKSFAEAEARLDHFIEAVYNTKRLHSRLGYRPPREFEAAWQLNHGGDPSLPAVR